MTCGGRGKFPGLWGNTVTFSAGVVDEDRRSASCSLILRDNPLGECQGRWGRRDLLDLAR